MRQATIAAIAFALMLSACGAFDPCNDARVDCIKWGKISYTNNTDEKLLVHFNTEGGANRVRPAETQTIPFVLPRPSEGERYDDEDDSVHIDFFDDHGCAAFTIWSTVRRIREERKSSFTIRQADLKPRAERSGCDPSWLPLPPYR